MNELVLPEEGVLSLSAEGVEISFLSEDETDGETTFVAAQTEEDNYRFDCHKVRHPLPFP
jgi:hypothetical protein